MFADARWLAATIVSIATWNRLAIAPMVSPRTTWYVVGCGAVVVGTDVGGGGAELEARDGWPNGSEHPASSAIDIAHTSARRPVTDLPTVAFSRSAPLRPKSAVLIMRMFRPAGKRKRDASISEVIDEHRESDNVFVAHHGSSKASPHGARSPKHHTTHQVGIWVGPAYERRAKNIRNVLRAVDSDKMRLGGGWREVR